MAGLRNVIDLGIFQERGSAREWGRRARNVSGGPWGASQLCARSGRVACVVERLHGRSVVMCGWMDWALEGGT